VSAIASAVKFVNSFARRQHLFDIATKPIDIDSNFFSYLAAFFIFNFAKNVIFKIFGPGRLEDRTDNLDKAKT